MKPTISEKDLQASIIKYLQAKRLFWYRNNTGVAKMGEEGRYVRFGSVGSPDLIVVDKGIYIGIEVKGTHGKQSPQQRGFQEKLEEAGGDYILAHSMDDVMGYFEGSPLQKAA